MYETGSGLIASQNFSRKSFTITMWMALSSSNDDKRKANDKPTKVRLTDIPDALMEQVASYLPHKSCIYFAKAMKSQSTSQHPSYFHLKLVWQLQRYHRLLILRM